MDSHDKFKNVLIFIEGLDLLDTTTPKTDLSSLNQYISEGNSTLIVDENSVSKTHPLLALFGFARTFSSEFKSTGQIKEGSVRPFEVSSAKGAKKSDNDEEVIEVKYVSHPNKFSEVTEASVLVVTDSKKAAEVCETVEVSYLYSKEQHDLGQIKNLNKEQKSVDLLIIHREVNKEQSIDTLNWIENILKTKTFTYDSLRLIFSSYGGSLSPRDLIQKHEEQLSVLKEEAQSVIRQILPKQTWQYYKGSTVLENTETISTVLLMINNRKGLNRADPIQSIEEYSDIKNAGRFGGKVIHSAGVLREILFELSKLPKFGA